jgi:A/G-specific adenine glycosylase
MRNDLVTPLLAWFTASARDLPWRRTRDPYGIWVSEIMLQQTQVKTVIPYWDRWLRELPAIRALAQAPAEKIHKLWEGLGYYTRVRNLQKAAQEIEARHGGAFPRDFDAILELQGIGRYTAGAISSIAFNFPAPILDGNVIRVLSRVHGITENPRDKTANEHLWQIAKNLVTDAGTLKKKFALGHGMETTGNCSLLNQSLMELGALICTPRQPKCDACPIAAQCVARREHRTDSIPNLEKRAAATARRFLALVAEHDGKFLVRQRPADVVNAHLWEFPNHEVTETSETIQQFAARLFPAPTPSPRSRRRQEAPSLSPLCIIKHSITRYRITLEAFRTRLKHDPRIESGEWKSCADLTKLAFTSAHRKILKSLA